MRRGPGRIVTVPVGACSLLSNSVSDWHRLAFDVDELRHLYDRIEYDQERFGRPKRDAGLLSGRQFQAVESDFLQAAFERCIVRELNSRTPENLAIILRHW